MSEHDIQKSIVQYLDWVLPHDQRIVAVPNNPRSRVSGAFEKARGTRAGFPDLILVGRVTGFLEVKTLRGRLTGKQKEWADWCHANGLRYATVHSIDDVRLVLDVWGIPHREAKRYGRETKSSQQKTSEAGDM